MPLESNLDFRRQIAVGYYDPSLFPSMAMITGL